MNSRIFAMTMALVALFASSMVAQSMGDFGGLPENAKFVGPGGKELSRTQADSLLQNPVYQMIMMMGDGGEEKAIIFKDKEDLKGVIPDEFIDQIMSQMSGMGGMGMLMDPKTMFESFPPDAVFKGPDGSIISRKIAEGLAKANYMLAPLVDEQNKTEVVLYESIDDLKSWMPKEQFEMVSSMPQGMPMGADFEGDKNNNWYRKPVIEFSSMDMNGNRISVSDFKGKVVVLKFWFVGCKPCIIEFPELNELVEEYESKDVVFLGITFDPKENVSSFFEKTGKRFDYRILPDNMDVIKEYGVKSYPTHMVIDKEGIVQFVLAGGVPGVKALLGKQIDKVL